MSATKGIDTRHRRGCQSKDGGPCTCKPTFQAIVFDKGTGRRIRKTFDTRTAARQWRDEAVVAVRKGDLSAERGPTLNTGSLGIDVGEWGSSV